METNGVSVEGLSKRIGDITPDVKRVLQAEKGENYDERLIADAIRRVVANKLEVLEGGMDEMFTSPTRSEFQELAGILEKRKFETKIAKVEEAVGLAREFADDSVFSGKLAFSKDKMAAMIEYLTAKGHHVYKTSLNKLLFYADLTNFYLSGRGMSGAVYYNRRFGPVADPAASVLTELVSQKKVNVEPRMQTLESVGAPEAASLTEAERKVLDWVAQIYGPMSAGAVSEFSHNEMAYKYTEANEPIAYAYAQFFKNLPPKNLLG